MSGELWNYGQTIDSIEVEIWVPLSGGHPKAGFQKDREVEQPESPVWSTASAI